MMLAFLEALTIYRIAGDGIALAEIVKERRQRGEFAPNAGSRQRACLQMLASGNHMGAGDGAQLGAVMQSRLREVGHGFGHSRFYHVKPFFGDTSQFATALKGLVYA
jgi:hypothetical protein